MNISPHLQVTVLAAAVARWAAVLVPGLVGLAAAAAVAGMDPSQAAMDSPAARARNRVAAVDTLVLVT